MSNWKFEIIRFDEVRGAVAQMLDEAVTNAQSSHVFFHPALVDAWLTTYRPLRRLEAFLLKATSADNEALLPMVLWHKNWKNAWMKVLVPVGYSDFDYHDPIFRTNPSEVERSGYWAELLACLRQEFDYDQIVLDGITDGMTDAKSAEASDRDTEWRQGEICPLLDLTDIRSEEDLMAFFKTSLRGDIRRQMRRLEEVGALTYREYTSWESIPQATFDEFMRQHTQRWPQAYKAPHFHENLLKKGLPAGVVHFSTLAVGETVIAWHLGFSLRGRYYYYMPAGNQEFFKFSPTKIHLFYLVRRGVEQGYTVYDHLRGEENYKSGWSNGSQFVNTMTVERHRLVSDMKRRALSLKSAICHRGGVNLIIKSLS